MNRKLARVFKVVSDQTEDRRSGQEKLRLLQGVAEEDKAGFFSFLLDHLASEKSRRDATQSVILELEAYLKELTQAPYRFASVLHSGVQPDDPSAEDSLQNSLQNRAVVKVRDEIFTVGIDPDLRPEDLCAGDGVFLNSKENIIIDLASDVPLMGDSVTVREVLPGQRLLVSSENGADKVVFRSARCIELDVGDVVVVTPHGFVTERLSEGEVDGVNTLQPEPSTQPIAFAGYERLVAETLAFKKIFRFPELAARYSLDTDNHLLLSGPPGTGKTLYTKNLAYELNAKLFVVNGSSLFDKYVGNTEKNIRELFRCVGEQSPSILLLDEADALAQKRGRDTQGHRDGFLNVLLGEINGALESPKFSVVVTTNRLDQLDSAFVKRFKTVHFPMPNRRAVNDIVKVHLETVPLSEGYSVNDFRDHIVNLITCPNAYNSMVRVGYRNGKSRVIEAREIVAGREIRKIVQEAGKRAFNRTDHGEIVPVTLRDFELAIEDQFNVWRTTLNVNNIRDYVSDLPVDEQIASVEPIIQQASVTYLYPEDRDVS